MPYLNARPLVDGLAGDARLDYREAVPSRLAEMLKAGALDAALVSSIESARIAGSRIAGGGCIASDGPVLSVKVFGEGDPREARIVALDGASRTAAALTRVAYREFLGRSDVRFVESPVDADWRALDADAALVIGDRALREPAATPAIDLGALWTGRTGLPFVWAVWLARDEATAAALAPILDAARERGTRRIEAIARDSAAAAGVDERLALRYLRDAMRYSLGDRERAGLARFLELSRA